MKIQKKTKLNILILFLFTILFCILFYGIKNERSLLSKNTNDYDNLNNSLSSNGNITLSDNDFYRKINSSEDVNILLLGDEITYGTTSETSLYPLDKNISDSLKSTYKINSNFIFVENNGFTVSDGNNALDIATNINNIDLAIISFGYNDSIQNIPLDEFAQKYSNLISKIKIINYNCAIICLLPPGTPENDSYVLKIKNICESSNIDYINLHQNFKNSDISYDELIKNDLPTEKGYDLILQNLNQLFKSYY